MASSVQLTASLSPANITDKRIEWTVVNSSSPGVITLANSMTNSLTATNIVTAQRAGYAFVKATALGVRSGTGPTDQWYINVSSAVVPITSIKMSSPDIPLDGGYILQPVEVRVTGIALEVPDLEGTGNGTGEPGDPIIMEEPQYLVSSISLTGQDINLDGSYVLEPPLIKSTGITLSTYVYDPDTGEQIETDPIELEEPSILATAVDLVGITPGVPIELQVPPTLATSIALSPTPPITINTPTIPITGFSISPTSITLTL
jgi:hypothetical protein